MRQIVSYLAPFNPKARAFDRNSCHCYTCVRSIRLLSLDKPIGTIVIQRGYTVYHFIVFFNLNGELKLTLVTGIEARTCTSTNSGTRAMIPEICIGVLSIYHRFRFPCVFFNVLLLEINSA